MDLIAVRATINLPGLRHGRVAIANPEEPYVAECLRWGWLVREPDLDPPTTGSALTVTGNDEA